MGGMILRHYLQNPFFKQYFKGKEAQGREKKKSEDDDEAQVDEC